MKIIFWIIGGSCIFLIWILYIVPLLQMYRLHKQFRKLKSDFEKRIVNSKTNYKRADEIMDRNPEAKEQLQIFLGIEETLGSVMKNQVLENLSRYQNELLDIERESQFEPRIWWTKWHIKKLENLKQEIREFIKKTRE